MQKVELGDRVKDRITGLTGIAVGKTEWLYGCTRILIQPEETKDGKQVDTSYIDEPQLVVVDKGAIERPESAKNEDAGDRPHGPREDPPRMEKPTR